MDSESEQNPKKVHVCRICDDIGSYALWEMHFCHENGDVPLIEAFNSFSVLDNVSDKNEPILD